MYDSIPRACKETQEGLLMCLRDFGTICRITWSLREGIQIVTGHGISNLELRGQIRRHRFYRYTNYENDDDDEEHTTQQHQRH